MTASRPRRIWTWRTPFEVLRRALVSFNEDRATLLAAAISYYAVFSLFPLVTLGVAVFGIFLRSESLQEAVLEAIVGTIPVDSPAIESSIREVARLGPTLTVVALIAMTWSATGLSGAVRRSVTIVFNVHKSRPMLRAKAIDYLALPIIGLAFLASFVLTAVWRFIEANFREEFPFFGGRLETVWALGAIAIPAVLTFFVFLFLYWLLPNRRVNAWHLVPGAALAAFGFELVKQVFAMYVANFTNFDVVYGSLASLMALLFWIFISANVFLFGAEVASETSHVLLAEPRHGYEEEPSDGREPGLRTAVWAFLRGLVFQPSDDVGTRDHESERPAAGD